MSKGINKVILVGNLGADPETRYTTSGDPVTNIRLATSETWKDKATGERQERTEWHTVVFWRRLAEIAGEYLRKGSRVYIEGSLRTRKWQAQDGSDRYTTEVVANEMLMLDDRNNAAPKTKSEEFFQNSQRKLQTQHAAVNGNDAMDFDDDIPF